MRGRISPPRELESVLNDLKESGAFRTKQKGMMFAAAVGYATEQFPELETVGEGIRLEYFRKKGDEKFINALAVAHADGLEILDSDRDSERIEIFQRYAAGGLSKIQARLSKEKIRSKIEVIADMLEELRQPKGDRVSELAGLL